jgi:hypothetical protein
MSFDRRGALTVAMAVLFLLFIVFQTRDALRRSGAWTRAQSSGVRVDPYANLDRQLEARSRVAPQAAARDPFSFAGGAPAIVPMDSGEAPPRPRRPDPVLTAIVSDEADPRALIRYEDRNYSVKAGDLFAEFMVVSVTRDEVVLDGGGRSLVLRRPGKGDQP